VSRWLVYIVRCRDGSLYTGITNDLPRRLAAHAAGRASRYTRSRLPVTLIHTEPQASKSAALKREAAIKRLRRAEKDRLLAACCDSGNRNDVVLAADRGGTRGGGPLTRTDSQTPAAQIRRGRRPG
jgi:putative endonuclease